MSCNERFPQQLRVRRQADFDRVYQGNAYAADPVLVVQVRENGLPYCRLGLSVSRKVGNAVVRNRWKRLIREAFRRCRKQLPQGLDLVVRPRRGAMPDHQAIRDSLPRVVRRAAKRMTSQTTDKPPQ